MSWKRIHVTRTFTVEKRGRMLRRARRFQRPNTYERTFTFSVSVRFEGAATAEIDIVWDPVKQRAWPRILHKGDGVTLSCQPEMKLG